MKNLRPILVAALALRLALALLTPPWQAPDEYPHYWVAESCARTGQLPVGSTAFPGYEAYQHPLYYSLLAGIISLSGAEPLEFTGEGTQLPATLLLLRLFSVILGTVVVAATWFLTRGLRPDRPDLPPIAAEFAAFLPSFAGVSSSLNNDTLLIFFSSLLLLSIFPPDQLRDPRRAVAAGVFAGAALATKLNALILFPVIAWAYWQFFRSDQRAAVRALLFTLPGIAAGAAIVVARNLLTYGSIVALPPHSPGAEITLSSLVHALRNLGGSFWLAAGRVYEIHPPVWVYLVTALPLTLFALLGWWRRRKEVAVKRDAFLVGLAVSSALAASLWFTLSYPEGTQTSWGKNVYPVLPLIAYAFAFGWSEAIPRFRMHIPLAGTALLLAGSLWICF